MIDHYLDTAERDLLKAGYACRLRESEADRQWRLTVKGLGKAEGARHEREEFECDVPPHSTPSDWPKCPAREIVLRASEGRPLAELFALRQLRSTRAVEQGERGVGELSLDTVDSEIAGHESHERELELEIAGKGTADDPGAIADGA